MEERWFKESGKAELDGLVNDDTIVPLAYIQSHTQLERDVYIRAPDKLGLEEVYVLKVVKPLYGIPESGLH